MTTTAFARATATTARVLAVTATATAVLGASCSTPAPAPPSPSRYVADPPTSADVQGDTVEPGADPALTDVLYVPGGIAGCAGSDETCETVFQGETFRGSHTMDLYAPPGVPGPDRPVLVWVHGGFGIEGDKSELGVPGYPADLLARQLHRGYVVAVVNYRLNVPSSTVDGLRLEEMIRPVAAEDVALAVRHLRLHATDYGIDPDRVLLWGHSWGAWAAQYAAVAPDRVVPDWLPVELAGVEARVAGVYAESGPADLPTSMPVAVAEVESTGEHGPIDESGAPPALLASWSPSTWVDSGDPPIYASYGDLDPLVPLADGELMADRFAAAGRTGRYRLDVVDRVAGTLLPADRRGHVSHPFAHRTELERFLDAPPLA